MVTVFELFFLITSFIFTSRQMLFMYSNTHILNFFKIGFLSEIDWKTELNNQKRVDLVIDRENNKMRETFEIFNWFSINPKSVW